VGQHGSSEIVLYATVVIWSASSQVNLAMRIVVPGPRRVYRTMGRLDPIAQTLHSFGFGAVVAAVKCAVFLQAVAHDLDAAMGT
jgi:hypothetical protein